MIRLGEKVKDSVTGFTGIAVMRVERWKGSTQFVVQSPELFEGKIIEEGFEEARLEKIEEARSGISAAA